MSFLKWLYSLIPVTPLQWVKVIACIIICVPFIYVNKLIAYVLAALLILLFNYYFPEE